MKKKIRIKPLLIFLLIIALGFASYYYYTTLRITNIYVLGNKILRESDIILETNLLEYPQIIKVSTSDIENKLMNNPLIKSVKVKKSILGKITITINENIPLFKYNDECVLSNGKSVNNKFNVPTLINEVDSDVYNKFINSMIKVNDSILVKISEIKYEKTELDKEKFLFLMNDGNYVYITLNRIELINSYNEIYPTLDKHKGILHLDSGNHFEIKS